RDHGAGAAPHRFARDGHRGGRGGVADRVRGGDMLARMTNLPATSIVHATYHPGTPGPLPTVVAIHGHGANSFDLLGLAPYLVGGRALVVCPQAEFELQAGALSYTWFEGMPGGRPG